MGLLAPAFQLDSFLHDGDEVVLQSVSGGQDHWHCNCTLDSGQDTLWHLGEPLLRTETVTGPGTSKTASWSDVMALNFKSTLAVCVCARGAAVVAAAAESAAPFRQKTRQQKARKKKWETACMQCTHERAEQNAVETVACHDTSWHLSRGSPGVVGRGRDLEAGMNPGQAGVEGLASRQKQVSTGDVFENHRNVETGFCACLHPLFSATACINFLTLQAH